jgi:hypothetical protein
MVFEMALQRSIALPLSAKGVSSGREPTSLSEDRLRLDKFVEEDLSDFTGEIDNDMGLPSSPSLFSWLKVSDCGP